MPPSRGGVPVPGTARRWTRSPPAAPPSASPPLPGTATGYAPGPDDALARPSHGAARTLPDEARTRLQARARASFTAWTHHAWGEPGAGAPTERAGSDERAPVADPDEMLASEAGASEAGEGADAGALAGLHHFAAGLEPGLCLHALIEGADLRDPAGDGARRLAARTLALFGLADPAAHRAPTGPDALLLDPEATALALLGRLADLPLPGAECVDGTPGTLGALAPQQRVAEWRFVLPLGGFDPHALADAFARHAAPALQPYAETLRTLRADAAEGLLSGTADLVCEWDGRYYLLDWKSNRLGGTDAAYTPAALAAAMRERHYVLQYHLYLVALDAHLRARLPGYRYDEHMGGVGLRLPPRRRPPRLRPPHRPAAPRPHRGGIQAAYPEGGLSNWNGEGEGERLGPCDLRPPSCFPPSTGKIRHPSPFMRPTPPAADQVLQALAAAQAAPPIGLALGRWLAGLDPDHAAPLALTGALLARAEADGQAGFPLDTWAGHPFPPADAEGAPGAVLPSLPAVGEWAALLGASPLAGGPADAPAPLVLDGGRLYLRRLWTAERRVADRLLARLDPPAALAAPGMLRAAFSRLFPDADGDAPDLQAVACTAALRHRLAVVSGGPGTGKTTTAARLLALACAARPGLRVALAAPTGKAAQRLHESMQGQLDRLGSDAVALAALPEPQTLHRLLGADARGRFRRHAEAPLAADLVLVDEASMLDLPLFDALLDALAPAARLVLLGDADQLAAVGVGAAFGDLCRLGAGPPSPAFGDFCRALGATPPATDAGASPFADAVVRLTRSYRFDADAGIGALAAAIRTGDAEAALAVLHDEAHPEATRAAPTVEAALAAALPHARDVVAAGTPEEALARLGRFQLLAALRGGPLGTRALNRAVDEALRVEGAAGPGPYYAGRPVLITENAYGLGLFNGDLGVAWPHGGAPSVAFADSAGVCFVPAARLPPHEGAWAMTVHRSQGSEFDHVAVALPEDRPDRLSRELLYTAVTRARRQALVLGSAAAVRAACAAREPRRSGLADRLGAPL